MNNFRMAVEVGDLHDLGYKGDMFTWSNRHLDETFAKERLNRALANTSWSQLYKRFWIENLVSRCSNHIPILATCNRLTYENYHQRSVSV